MHPTLPLRRALAPLLLALGVAAGAVADGVTVALAEGVRETPATGRIVLFFVEDSIARRMRRVRPASGPFWEPPQPIVSIAVADLAGGAEVEIPGDAPGYPGPLETLEGRYHLQAILDADRTERSATEGPGNVLSEVVAVELRRDRDDRVRLTLGTRIEGPRGRVDRRNLRYVTLPSPRLSAFANRPVVHRAGVALPESWLAEEEDALSRGELPTRAWPVVFVIPGYGGRETAASGYARMLGTPGVESVAPRAVFIVLDAESPLGHHGFADSPNSGPVGTALVEELIPHLTERYRLATRPEGRIVTGHSSGAWSSLWLVLHHPEVFGACWATAPDPVDFSAFQMTDLYRDASIFVGPDGTETPSLRAIASAEGATRVVMTVREERGLERAIDPDGGSGEQWDGWMAMFSPRDPATGMPVPLFDPATGAIDRAVVNDSWARYDIARLVAADRERYGPLVTERVRLLCGGLDSFFLERAVARFAALVAELPREPDAPGYVEILPDETHGTLADVATVRLNEEMREHLDRSGFPQGD